MLYAVLSRVFFMLMETMMEKEIEMLVKNFLVELSLGVFFLEFVVSEILLIFTGCHAMIYQIWPLFLITSSSKVDV